MQLAFWLHNADQRKLKMPDLIDYVPYICSIIVAKAYVMISRMDEDVIDL